MAQPTSQIIDKINRKKKSTATSSVSAASASGTVTASTAIAASAAHPSVGTEQPKKAGDCTKVVVKTGDLASLKLLLPFTPYQKIKYSIKPIKKSKTLTELDPKSIAEKCNMKAWVDGVYSRVPFVEPSGKQTLMANDLILSSLKERITKPFDQLVVCEMNSIVGRGVFCDLQTKKIPKHTVIAVSGGIVEPDDPNFAYPKEMGDYLFEWDLRILAEDNTAPAFIARMNIAEFGNFFRFFQDVPSKAELEEINNVSIAVKANIQTANCRYAPASANGIPFMYIYTIEKIAPGSPIVIQYADDSQQWFEDRNIRRYVMDKDGEVVGYIERRDGKKQLIFDYPQRFIGSVNQILDIFTKLYAHPDKDAKIRSFIGSLKEVAKPNPKNEVEKQFIELQALLELQDKQNILNNELKTLKQKLDRYMEEYIAGRKVECLPAPAAKMAAPKLTESPAPHNKNG